MRRVMAMPARLLRRLLALAVLGLLALAPAVAQADPAAELSIEDNNVMFSPAAPVAAAQWKALGVDTVRIAARWNRIAPAVNSPAMPARFNPADPNSPGYAWGELDYAIKTLTTAGLKPEILIPLSGPLWASANPAFGLPEYKPRPEQFSAFAQAVVRRYAPRGAGRFLLGNEPNQSFFLKPQLECRGRNCTDYAPSHYRRMLLAAYPAAKAIAPGAQFLIGELAPIGSTVRNPRSSLKPLAFLRGLGCLDKDFRAVTARANPNCAGFRAAIGDGFSFHPYQVKQPPAAKQSDPDLVKLGDLPKLFATLDKVTAKGRLRATTGRFNVYLTEFGYETNPPDGKFGVSPALQAQYLQQGAYIAWATPRVKLFSQYVWRDEVNPGGFASGLLFANGRPKPSLTTFPAPIFYDPEKKRLWGQVRPGGATKVTILRGGKPAMRVNTNAMGYFVVPNPPPGAYTFTFTLAHALPLVSATSVRVAR
jgi:hypothetical protein